MFRIEDILKEKGFSKKDFAERMETSKQNVNSLLKNPTKSKIEQMAKVLEVPVWQLFASPDEVMGETASQSLVCPYCGKPLRIRIE